MRLGAALFALATLGFTAAIMAAPADRVPRMGNWGVDLGDQDRSVRPGDDFYLHQNGAWVTRTVPDINHPFKSYWRDVRDIIPPRLISLLQQMVADRSPNLNRATGKAGTLFREYLDEAAIEQQGHAPIEPELVAVHAARTRSDMAEQMGRLEGPLSLHAANLNDHFAAGPVALAIQQDRQHPDRNALYLGQGGILLPDISYYVRPELADIRQAYQHYIEQMLAAVGWSDPAAAAVAIVAFETRIAKASTPLEALSDPARTYNRVTPTRLKAMAPGFDWDAYFRGAGMSLPASLIIDDPAAFMRIAAIYADADLPMLRARQAFAIADRNAAFLSHDLYALNLAFRVNAMNTVSAVARDRQQGGERLIEAVLPDTLGSIYVQRFSSPRVQMRVKDMVAHLRKALDARLQHATWLSPQSRILARRKLAAMDIRVGYPEHFEAYEKLRIAGDSLYADVHRAAFYQWRELVGRLSRPYDRARWALPPMYPQYLYDPQANTANVADALLQPPFFDAAADDAVNYGAVGTIIAQQMVTAFGQGGIEYDAHGRLNPWLKPGEAKHFSVMLATFAARYSAMEPIPGVHPRGQILAGEAMADVGALEVALDAYHLSLAGRAAPRLDHLTGDQRFFLGRAQSWRAKFTDDAVRNQLAQGSNAVPWMRVNGPLPNLDGWYRAFGVATGDRMYLAPELRVHPL